MYYRVVIPLLGRVPDVIGARLYDFAVEGIEEQDDALVGYFLDEEEARASAAELGGASAAVEDQNWSESLQQEWRPLLVGQRFFLCPAWVEEPAPEGRIRLEMVPGNVFGGGDHATTQLCLELLETLAAPGVRIADVGCGTGILTRAARALGAWSVGCDIDPASAGLADFLGSADALAPRQFDGVAVNIHLGVLRGIAAELQRIRKPGGWLLVSGFLPEQREELAALFGKPLLFRERDGWCAALIY